MYPPLLREIYHPFGLNICLTPFDVIRSNKECRVTVKHLHRSTIILCRHHRVGEWVKQIVSPSYYKDAGRTLSQAPPIVFFDPTHDWRTGLKITSHYLLTVCKILLALKIVLQVD